MAEERRPPFAQEAERYLLGACLLDTSSLPEVLARVEARDFFLTQNQKVFLALKELAVEGKTPEEMLLIEKLEQTGHLEDAGGAGYISSLTDGLPRSANVKHYAESVRAAAKLRRSIVLFSAMVESSYARGADPREILEQGVRECLALLSDERESGLPVNWDDAAASAVEKIRTSFDSPGDVMRIESGIPGVDTVTSGLRREEVILLVGMTGHGKSTLGMQIVTCADSAGLQGIVFSAEMSKEALATRELAHSAGIPLWHFRRPEKVRDKEGDLRRLRAAYEYERRRKLLVMDRDITPSRLWAVSEMVKRTRGLDYIAIDYDQLVIRGGLRRVEEQFSEQTKFMSDCINMAKRLGICILLLCQPRKVDEEVARGQRRPRIEDIFGSSSAANAAHVIMWIVRRFLLGDMKDDAKRHEAACHILKARNDRVGTVPLDFDEENVLFKDTRDWDRMPEARRDHTSDRDLPPESEAREPGEDL